MPRASGHSEEANGNSEDNHEEGGYVIRFTGESFSSYSDYIKRLDKYRERIWTCEQTGKNHLTFEEALRSEKKARELAHRFPQEYYEKLAKLVHHHAAKGVGTLVDEFYASYKDIFIVGEEVDALIGGKHFTARINRLPEGEDVTSEVTDQHGAKHTLPKSSVKKSGKVTKLVIKQKILDFAKRESYHGAVWVVQDQDLIKKFGLPEQLPEKVQELQDAYERKHKKRKGGDAENGETKKRKTDGKPKSQSIKYPIADELLEHDKSKVRPPSSTEFDLDPDLIGDLLMVWTLLRTFGKSVLRLWPYSLEDLENSLRHADDLNLIAETHVSLLKNLGKRSVTTRNWQPILQSFLADEDDFTNEDIVHSLKDTSFAHLPIAEKLEILHYLCEEVLDTDEVRDNLNENSEVVGELNRQKREEIAEEKRKEKERQEADKEKSKEKNSEEAERFKQRLQKIEENFDNKASQHFVRIEPIGVDRDHNRYYYFPDSGGRLFVESPNPKGNPTWSYYSHKEEMDALLDYLDVRGVREKELKQNLMHKYNRINVEIVRRNTELTTFTSVRRSARLQETTERKEKERSYMLYENRLE
eukprot:TRINITY_DN6562_c0_g1_i1.p1 TRINITY_DN6562_c0_g1~~TRINITY_DN6562_c0_g1_i1.p1  ORF type:complete len:586 (+),score=161.04 TRINITY_DN6562_c0_g1_i1:102-1859(+)